MRRERKSKSKGERAVTHSEDRRSRDFTITGILSMEPKLIFQLSRKPQQVPLGFCLGV